MLEKIVDSVMLAEEELYKAIPPPLYAVLDVIVDSVILAEEDLNKYIPPPI